MARLSALFTLLFAALAASACVAQPFIDVHRHGAWAYGDDEGSIASTRQVIKDTGMDVFVVSVTDYGDPEKWRTAFGEQAIVGVKAYCPRNTKEPRYICFPADEGWADIGWLRSEIAAGRVQALHELSPNYYGIPITNPRIAPYLALAAEFDIPVGIHTQRGPPPEGKFTTRAEPGCCPDYDPEMGNPALLRPVLERHPGLRVWIQHVGAGRDGGYEPFWDETMALLSDYPQVYVDLSITNGPRPIEQYEYALHRLIDAGYGDRIMFGSDMVPIERIMARLDSFTWLDPAQKRAILRDNAVRFFRLKE